MKRRDLSGLLPHNVMFIFDLLLHLNLVLAQDLSKLSTV